MKQALSYALLAFCVFISYQGYQNSEMGTGTDALARQAACAGDDDCAVKDASATTRRNDPIRRRYEWRTPKATVFVECRREWIFLGEWSCETSE